MGFNSGFRGLSHLLQIPATEHIRSQYLYTAEPQINFLDFRFSCILGSFFVVEAKAPYK